MLMLEKILNHLNNDFIAQKPKSKTQYTITDGILEVDNFVDGQYVRIYGSVLNDGIYQVPLSGLKDETFIGYVVPLAIPKIILTLAEEIEQWTKENKPTAYTSESFGGYSYSKAINENGTAIGWQEVFANELKPYRKTKQH